MQLWLILHWQWLKESLEVESMEPDNSNYFNFDNDFLSGTISFPIEQ